VKPDVREHFLKQADACDQLGSPFTARLCRTLPTVLDETTATGNRVVNWPGDPRADALALRLCGGFHNLVLIGADKALAAIYPPATAIADAEFALVLGHAISRHDGRLHDLLDSAPQTNEVARSGMLLPGFLTIARETGLPLAVHEIGASAGLNLLFDRFHYRYGDATWGDRKSPARLAPEVRGQMPPLHGALSVSVRVGCDRLPVDLADAGARLRLQSYVWPDQPQRLERLRGALMIAAAEPPRISAEDALAHVARKLEQRRAGAAFVLFHSIMWQYMPAASQAEISRLLDTAGKSADASSPIAWLRMEPDDTRDPHAMLTLTLWPDGSARKLARCDYHGRWIEWIGGQA
jgi:hypothetical protein